MNQDEKNLDYMMNLTLLEHLWWWQDRWGWEVVETYVDSEGAVFPLKRKPLWWNVYAHWKIWRFNRQVLSNPSMGATVEE